MTQITPPLWDDIVDRDNLKAFLETTSGQRAINRLFQDAPSLLGKGETNEILIRSGEARGWGGAIELLLSLASPVAKPGEEPVSSYPRLDDDSQWDDGDKSKKKGNQ